jgi:3-oxoacyl-[acyl-carrier protein] reductase
VPELDGRVAIVTGAAAGNGRAIAEKLAQNGATVVIADINFENASKTAGEIAKTGARTHAVKVDVSSEADVKKMVDEVVSKFGGVHILVNNAGIGYATGSLDDPSHALIENLTEKEWDRTMGVNVKGMFLCCKYVAPVMKKQKWGKIVSISSRAGRQGGGSAGGSGPAYGVSKAGVINLTKTVARQLGPYNVNVNCIAPGTIEGTGFVMSEDEKASDRKAIPLGKLGTPQDVGEVAFFLCSPAARFVHGITFDLDGGRGMW